MKKHLFSAIALIGVAATSSAEITVVPTTFTRNGETYIMESQKGYEIYDSEKSLNKQVDNTFNEKNLITCATTKSWDPVWEQLNDQSKVEYEYDAAGNLIKKTNFYNYAEDAEQEAVWKMTNYNTYTYGADNKMTLREEYSKSDDAFYVSDRLVYEYDDEGHLVKESRYGTWDPAEDLALRSVSTYSEFNELNLATACTTERYYNGQITSTDSVAYTYDEKGNLTSKADFGKGEDGDIVKTSETVFTYTDDNMVDTEIYYATERSSGQWGPFYRWDYFYDETVGYPVKMDYYVYSLDFMSNFISSSNEYIWKSIHSNAVRSIDMDEYLEVTVNDGRITVNSPEAMKQVVVYDMNGNALRTVSQQAAYVATVDASGLKGCFIVVASGDFGSKAKKISF